MTKSMRAVLTRAKSGKMFQMTKEDPAFQTAFEAAQRGWITLSKDGVVYGPGGVPCILLILGLTAEGHAALDVAADEAEARTPKAKAKRVGLFIGIKLRDLFFMIVGAILLKLVERLFTF